MFYVFIQELIRTVSRARKYKLFERFSRHHIILDGLRRRYEKDIVQHSERILPYFVNLCTEVIVIHGIYNALSAETVTAAAAAEQAAESAGTEAAESAEETPAEA